MAPPQHHRSSSYPPTWSPEAARGPTSMVPEFSPRRSSSSSLSYSSFAALHLLPSAALPVLPDVGSRTVPGVTRPNSPKPLPEGRPVFTTERKVETAAALASRLPLTDPGRDARREPGLVSGHDHRYRADRGPPGVLRDGGRADLRGGAGRGGRGGHQAGEGGCWPGLTRTRCALRPPRNAWAGGNSGLRGICARLPLRGRRADEMSSWRARAYLASSRHSSRAPATPGVRGQDCRPGRRP